MDEEKPQCSKSFIESKTVTANLLLASGVEIFPHFAAWIASHPETSILLVSLLNIVLRRFTWGSVHFVKPKPCERP